jgi:2-oxoglutarate ferredoxin oxidoreductase subunit alpha
MMEPLALRPRKPRALPSKDDWTLTGAVGRTQHIVKSFFIIPGDLVKHNKVLQAKYRQIEENEVRCEEVDVEGAALILVAYGTSARVCLEAMRTARKQGLKLGLIRPITLWPYPSAIIRGRAEQGYRFLTVEMSAGQMLEDVRLAVEGRAPVGFCGRCGGGAPETGEIIAKAKEMLASGPLR